MKALIYARQSSGKDDLSESVEAQIDNCKKLAAKEKIDNMRAIFESLQVGKSLAETLDDSLTNTFVEEDIKHEAQKVQEKEELDQLDNEVFQ